MTFMRKFMDFLTLDKTNSNEPNLSNETELIFNNDISFDNNLYVTNSSVPTPSVPAAKISPEICITHNDNTISYVSETVPVTVNQNYAVKEECDIGPYVSKRLMIPGFHIFFIDICRDIIECGYVNKIPLMREYHLTESDINSILYHIYEAGIIDRDYNLIMDSISFEKYIDLYEPNIFYCQNCVFDKDIFKCMGEIIFDDGVDKTYDSMSADEVIDYLTVFEKLHVLCYNSLTNQYDILMSKEEFYDKCSFIPDSFSSFSYSSDEKYKICDFDSLSGLEFEKYISYLLHNNGYTNVVITPPSGDHGIDITAEKDNISYAIQCKCYSSNVGNSAVQQAHTGKHIYKKDISVVITNQHFTQQAIDEANQLGVKLWDREKIMELISNI